MLTRKDLLSFKKMKQKIIYRIQTSAIQCFSKIIDQAYAARFKLREKNIKAKKMLQFVKIDLHW